MKILGLCHDCVICSAGIVVDGEVVTAIAEERLDRRKQSRVFPMLAIQECLKQASLTMADIDEIAVGWNPAIDLETMPGGYLDSRRWRTEYLMQTPARFMQLTGGVADEMLTQSTVWKGAPPITYVNHYLAHVGNAAYLSGYDSTAVLILDGRGERHTGLLANLRGTELEVLEEICFPHSLGLFYGAITQFLGFRPDSDEWKVMALAAFGERDNEFYKPLRQAVQVNERGHFTLDMGLFEFNNYWDRRMYSDRFVSVFGTPRKRGDELTQRHNDLAWAMQRVFEEAVAEITTRLYERSGIKRLVAAGGCFMNSVFNGKIAEMTPFQEYFISGTPDDSGNSIGAALWLEAQRTGKAPKKRSTHNYWGRQYSDSECQDIARRYKIPNSEVVENPSQRAAEDLVAGKLVGWFQGRSEFGQRALGNRSILADPRLPNGKDIINAAVKFRESFRPFAPAILAERVGEYFECPADSRVAFMERVFRFKPEKRKLVPSVTHEDGTGRLQTVDANTSPRFHGVIQAFEKLTGVPIVLNTSFNLNGEPMVDAPEDAIRTFYSCGLDVLYLGNVRIAK